MFESVFYKKEFLSLVEENIENVAVNEEVVETSEPVEIKIIEDNMSGKIVCGLC